MREHGSRRRNLGYNDFRRVPLYFWQQRKAGAENLPIKANSEVAVRFLDNPIQEEPKTKHPPRKSSMEQRLMEAKKAFKQR
jgi:hypothetical protein